ncbi:M23 family metallopeptidase [Nocardia sp. alder85J]|uniref:M23 family metallopeptidase n=1 Tax=Nocardia sp. alder85J TaxID=2862949 RepID=UPI001CD1D0D2|nr:M23 family metallopeptidase [Nocardia sp. alder85J]MCX4097694.1 M23 family metallopeptidase [Nocardia sp. alder85J]
MSMNDDDVQPRRVRWVWLIVVGPVCLCVVIGLSGTGGDHHGSGNCLPDMPVSDTTIVRWPLDHREVSSPFGDRDGGFHYGTDFAAPDGTPILAATSGTVAAAGPATGFGQWIVVDTTLDNQPYSTVYGHMPDTGGVLVHVGDQVTAGQHIANVGHNGEASGPHLHFEVWPGGRLSGGHAIDPLPWLTGHAGPMTATTADAAALAQPAPVGGDTMLAPLPDSVGSEDHLQVDTIRLVRLLHEHFPQIRTIYGWRAADPYPDHPSGRAADFMLPTPPGWDSDDGKALGEQIADYVMSHADELHVVYAIFRQVYRPAHGTPNTMEDRGSPTENHMDHVHVTVEGHGYPAAGQTYSGLTGDTAGSGCDRPAAAGDTTVRPGAVPDAYSPWIARAARTCPEVTAPLIAAQLEQESGFRDVDNPASGALGPAQFLPETWAGEGVDGDGDGTRDPHSIPDAVMSQASYDCKLAAQAKSDLAQGILHGDLTQLWLSAYNCGPAATRAAGQVCQNPETLAYVTAITSRAAAFTSGSTDVLAGAPR